MVATLVYFSPVLEGKQYVGSDTESWESMAQEVNAWNKEHPDNQSAWTDAMFGGMPTYQISFKQGPDLLQVTLGNTLYKLPTVVLVMFVYLLGAYILLLCLGFNPWLSMAMTVPFCFCSYNYIILAAGHNTKALTIAWLPALLGSVALAFRGHKWVGSILAAVFTGLVIRAGHYQIIYYGLLMIGALAVSELVMAVREKRMKEFALTSGLLVVAAVIGVALNATVLLTTKEYSDYTMRGKSNGLTEKVDTEGNTGARHGLDKDYITAWSYGKAETLTLLIPNAMGGSSNENIVEGGEVWNLLRENGYGARELRGAGMPMYWGDQPFTSGPVYAGIVAIFLAIIGLQIVKGRDKWWLVFALILSLLLSWGRNFMPLTEFFIDHVPMYNMFRTVSMTLVVTCLCIALLAALGMKEWFGNEDLRASGKLGKALGVSVCVTAGMLLLGWLFLSVWGSFSSPNDPSGLESALAADRRSMLMDDVLRGLFLLLFAAGALWLSLKKTPIKWGWIVGALALLMVIDMAPVAKRYLNNDMFVSKRTKRHTKRYVDEFILNQDRLPVDNPRVLDLTVNVFNSSATSYYHHTIGGYHAAKLRRYQELIDSCLMPELGVMVSTLNGRDGVSPENFMRVMESMEALNMLNTKWIVLDPNSAAVENVHRNGAAWLVDSVQIARNADDEIGGIERIHTKTTVVMDSVEAKRLGVKASGALALKDASDRIVLQKYAPNELVYLYRGKSPRMAVFSEIYYDKGWKAYVDDKEVAYGRGDYLLRVMQLPAGSHTIKWKFEPESLRNGDRIKLAASGLLLIAIFACCVVGKISY